MEKNRIDKRLVNPCSLVYNFRRRHALGFLKAERTTGVKRTWQK